VDYVSWAAQEGLRKPGFGPLAPLREPSSPWGDRLTTNQQVAHNSLRYNKFLLTVCQ
jgi:hypothetical protein